MLWKSGLFGVGNENIEADAITGALETCMPSWPRDHVKTFVATYIVKQSSALASTAKLYPAMLHLPRFEQRAQKKFMMLAAASGVGLFLVGLAVGKRIWVASHTPQIASAELELTAEEDHEGLLLQ